jgi:hypothetical protein
MPQTRTVANKHLLANRIFCGCCSICSIIDILIRFAGTKVLWCQDYEAIRHNCGYFGDFDPFGVAREYCKTNIPRFQHNRLLMYMIAFAFMKLNIV